MYKKIYETKNKRFYKLETYITCGKFGKIVPTKYVLISDSITINERLAFAFYFLPGYNEKVFLSGGKYFIKVDKAHIAGNMALINEGGNNTHLKSDKELLRYIITLNS